MALIFIEKTGCGICGKPVCEGEDYVAFPAFLPITHRLWKYSDSAFHSSCFANDPLKEDVQNIYAEWRMIWESRPRHLKTDEERNAWGKSAFANFMKTHSE